MSQAISKPSEREPRPYTSMSLAEMVEAAKQLIPVGSVDLTYTSLDAGGYQNREPGYNHVALADLLEAGHEELAEAMRKAAAIDETRRGATRIASLQTPSAGTPPVESAATAKTPADAEVAVRADINHSTFQFTSNDATEAQGYGSLLHFSKDGSLSLSGAMFKFMMEADGTPKMPQEGHFLKVAFDQELGETALQYLEGRVAQQLRENSNIFSVERMAQMTFTFGKKAPKTGRDFIS